MLLAPEPLNARFCCKSTRVAAQYQNTSFWNTFGCTQKYFHKSYRLLEKKIHHLHGCARKEFVHVRSSRCTWLPKGFQRQTWCRMDWKLIWTTLRYDHGTLDRSMETTYTQMKKYATHISHVFFCFSKSEFITWFMAGTPRNKAKCGHHPNYGWKCSQNIH